MRGTRVTATAELITYLFTEGSSFDGCAVAKGLPADARLVAVRFSERVDPLTVEFYFTSESENLRSDTEVVFNKLERSPK